MFFVFDRRRAFVRSSTHTVVFESDPDFERFRHDPSGQVQGFLHVWIADDLRTPMSEVAYLGGVSLRPGRKLVRSQVRRIVTSLRRVAGARAARLERRLARHFATFLAESRPTESRVAEPVTAS